MKQTISLLILALSCTAFAHAADQRCLAVYPISGNRLQGLAAGAYVGLAISHGERYGFIEATGLSVRDTKPHYKKKELEALEASGVKIIITTEPAVHVNGDVHRQGADRNNRDEAVSATAEQSAGCKVIAPAAVAPPVTTYSTLAPAPVVTPVPVQAEAPTPAPAEVAVPDSPTPVPAAAAVMPATAPAPAERAKVETVSPVQPQPTKAVAPVVSATAPRPAEGAKLETVSAVQPQPTGGESLGDAAKRNKQHKACLELAKDNPSIICK